MAGMRWLLAPTGAPDDWGDRGRVTSDQDGINGACGAHVGSVPDFSDDATKGCLLALVREAWGETAHMVRLQTHDSGGAPGDDMVPACWWALATGLTSRPLLVDGCRYVAAPTEVEALVAALESAPCSTTT
jgi:hypothetical protein